MATLRERVLAALETVREADGVIVHGAGRVLAFRPPSLNGSAVLIDLDHDDPPATEPRQEPVRADVRRLPVQLDLPER